MLTPQRRGPTSARLRWASAAGALVLAWSIGCTTLRPAPLPPDAPGAPPRFSDAALDRVLQGFVDEHGRVDYTGLQQDPGDLDRAYAAIAATSPDGDPERFPTTADRLAYWVNAYNAVVLRTVLQYYPIASVGDVKAPLLLRWIDPHAGFFVFQEAVYGGHTTNLYFVENHIVRRRFRDPRIHFALNCASRGCPRLPRRVFSADLLDEQLNAAAVEFFAEARNLRIDDATRTVHLSSILGWYASDFTGWYEATHPGERGTLLKYAALYAPPETAARLRVVPDFDVHFVPYDWRLNDQRGAP